jgi:hypothetical protein
MDRTCIICIEKPWILVVSQRLTRSNESNAQAVIAQHAYAYGKKLSRTWKYGREKSTSWQGIDMVFILWFIINDYFSYG